MLSLKEIILLSMVLCLIGELKIEFSILTIPVILFRRKFLRTIKPTNLHLVNKRADRCHPSCGPCSFLQDMFAEQSKKWYSTNQHEVLRDI